MDEDEYEEEEEEEEEGRATNARIALRVYTVHSPVITATSEGNPNSSAHRDGQLIGTGIIA